MSNDKLVCAACHKNRSNLLRCSQCWQVYYCNPQCQKKHWKKHKTACKCFTVEAIPEKGFGIVATRKIKQGETILAEDPVLILDIARPQEEKVETLVNDFEKLSLFDKSRVENLYDSDPEADCMLKVVRIFKSNSIQVGNSYPGLAGLYPNIARINHSCAPNVVWSWTNGNKQRKEVRALTDVNPGEELCTNYIDDYHTNYNTRDVRRKVLSGWHFTCMCSVCSLSEDKLQDNNDIRCTIWRNHSLIPELVGAQDIEGCIGASKSKLEGILSLGNQLISDLPAAYLETYEFLAIAKALKLPVEEDPELYREKAEILSKKFGDKFELGYKTKLQEILYGE